MTRIAHLSDLHLIENEHYRRRGLARTRLSFLSFGRALDAPTRRTRVRTALRRAAEAKAEHLVVTGDLTEDGTESQFEVLAELLLESDFRSERVTLVPGNHDLYADDDAWTVALSGPLRPFAKTSALDAVLELGDVDLMGASTAIPQTFTRSAGAVDHERLEAIRRAARDSRRSRRPLLVAQHHPPTRHALFPVQWVDGLQGAAGLRELMHQCAKVYVLHGHTHRAENRALDRDGRDQMFSAPAVVECDDPLRVYDVSAEQQCCDLVSQGPCERHACSAISHIKEDNEWRNTKPGISRTTISSPSCDSRSESLPQMAKPS